MMMNLPKTPAPTEPIFEAKPARKEAVADLGGDAGAGEPLAPPRTSPEPELILVQKEASYAESVGLPEPEAEASVDACAGPVSAEAEAEVPAEASPEEEPTKEDGLSAAALAEEEPTKEEEVAAAPPVEPAVPEPVDPEPAMPETPTVFTEPLMQHDAQITGEAPLNLATHNRMCRLEGAFSFMCTLRMDGTDNWTRVFDFSLSPDEDSITCGAVELSQDLHFTIFRGRKPISVRVPGFFKLGRECKLLCTVSESGHMKVYKDGLMVGQNPDGLPPLMIDRPHMIVGGHFHFRSQIFRGYLKDVKVWDQEVSWPKQEDEKPQAEVPEAAPAPPEQLAEAQPVQAEVSQ